MRLRPFLGCLLAMGALGFSRDPFKPVQAPAAVPIPTPRVETPRATVPSHSLTQDLQWVGTIQGAGPARVFLRDASGRTYRVRVGDSLGPQGIEVVAIERQTLKLRKGTKIIVLHPA